MDVKSDENMNCERCLTHNKEVELTLIQLEYSDIQKKMKEIEKKTSSITIALIGIGYDYFECSNCGFWKFVKRERKLYDVARNPMELDKLKEWTKNKEWAKHEKRKLTKNEQ